MNTRSLPVLYANDNSAYVMRARIVLMYSGIDVEHREVDINNKPPSLLKASPKGTVPTLVLSDGSVIDESWEIVRWAIQTNDPNNWIGENNAALELAEELNTKNDEGFDEPAMYYKFPSFYPDRVALQEISNCEPFLDELEQRLSEQLFMYGSKISIADIPMFPAVNRFSKVEPEWFDDRFRHVKEWIERMSTLPHIHCVKFGHTPWKFD